MTPEGKVKKAVKERLAYYGVLPFMEVAQLQGPGGVAGMYYMPVAGPFSVHGVHDFVGSWYGTFWSIETKAPDNLEDATPHQEMFRVAASRTGGISLVGVRSADAVDKLHELVLERFNTLVKVYA